MTYPVQVPRTYVNPQGDIIASGLYRSYTTQELANDFPAWMHLRQNPRSVGQQLIAATAVHMEKIEKDLEYHIRSKFLKTAPVEEIDVLYRVSIPSNINLQDASASGVRCIAAPSGCSPSGVNQVWVGEAKNLEDFYYNSVPTGMEVISSGYYPGSINGSYWNIKPSGILDAESKKYDVWKYKHDLTWCYAGKSFRKQDIETMEDYETYPYDSSANITDMSYSKGLLWAVRNKGSDYHVVVLSTKTQEPAAASLDTIAEFNVTGLLGGLVPSGILIDKESNMWLCDTNKTRVFGVKPRYDYFILDKVNQYIYFREDYRNSGVFVSNT